MHNRRNKDSAACFGFVTRLPYMEMSSLDLKQVKYIHLFGLYHVTQGIHNSIEKNGILQIATFWNGN